MRIVKAGATSQSIYIEVLDSTSTTGGRKTGLVFNTSSLTAYYVKNGAAAVAITLATLATPSTAWSSGGFVEVDATNMPGVYRLDVPDAAFSSGASTVVTLKGATGMVQVSSEVQLTAFDFQTATQAVNVTQWSGTNVSAPATAGIPEVNVKNINNVSAASVTTISANQGTTQPINFTGTAGSALAKSDMVDVAGAAVSTSSAQIGVNAVNIGGTAQTGRDIGASVLLSTGTGAGQLDFTSGVVKANLAQILGTALTETAGQLAAAFKQFFNIASPTSTMNVITTVTTATTATTATNLTNAPTAGDFTATMKTSLNNATPAVTVSDKTGFSLSAAGVQAIWDALTSALTTVGSIGKLLVTNVDALISSRTKPADTQAAVTLVTTTTNLTNAATAGDFTSTMKTSLNAATPASVVGAVGSVTGNVGGNVVGSVASVTAGVTVTTNNDKTAYALSSTGLNAVIPTEPGAVPTFGSSTIVQQLAYLFALALNKITQTGSTQTVRNNADSGTIATYAVSDDSVTATKGKAT